MLSPILIRALRAIETAAYTDQLVPQILMAMGISNLPGEVTFQVHKESDAFIVDTNLDFVALNAEYTHANPDRSLNAGLILDILYEGYAEVDFAATLATEMAPTPTESVIAKERVASVLELSGRSFDRLIASSIASRRDGRAILKVGHEKVPVIDQSGERFGPTYSR